MPLCERDSFVERKCGTNEVLGRIGEGGMGEAYAVEQLEPVVRRVALKLIEVGMDTHEVIARFQPLAPAAGASDWEEPERACSASR